MTALTKVPIPTLEHVQSSGLDIDKLKLGQGYPWVVGEPL